MKKRYDRIFKVMLFWFGLLVIIIGGVAGTLLLYFDHKFWWALGTLFATAGVLITWLYVWMVYWLYIFDSNDGE